VRGGGGPVPCLFFKNYSGIVLGATTDNLPPGVLYKVTLMLKRKWVNYFDFFYQNHDLGLIMKLYGNLSKCWLIISIFQISGHARFLNYFYALI